MGALQLLLTIPALVWGRDIDASVSIHTATPSATWPPAAWPATLERVRAVLAAEVAAYLAD